MTMVVGTKSGDPIFYHTYKDCHKPELEYFKKLEILLFKINNNDNFLCQIFALCCHI